MSVCIFCILIFPIFTLAVSAAPVVACCAASRGTYTFPVPDAPYLVRQRVCQLSRQLKYRISIYLRAVFLSFLTFCFRFPADRVAYHTRRGEAGLWQLYVQPLEQCPAHHCAARAKR